MFTSLGFVIHPGKSVFITSQVIEYLGFVVNSVTMTVLLTELKQKSLAELCHNLSSKHKVAICEIEKVLRTISGNLIEDLYERLHSEPLRYIK